MIKKKHNKKNLENRQHSLYSSKLWIATCTPFCVRDFMTFMMTCRKFVYNVTNIGVILCIKFYIVRNYKKINQVIYNQIVTTFVLRFVVNEKVSSIININDSLCKYASRKTIIIWHTSNKQIDILIAVHDRDNFEYGLAI